MSDGKQQRLEYTKLSPAGIASMRTLEHYLNAESGLEKVLLELVRLRASLMNGCAFCIGLHTHELRRSHEPEQRIAAVASWAESDAYTQRERTALRWTEVLTRIEGEVPEEEFATVRAHFSDRELVDLSLAIASINAWNRLGVAFLPQWNESRAGGKAMPEQTQAAPADDSQTGGLDNESFDDEGKAAQDEATS